MDRIQGTKLSVGRVKYEKNPLMLNEYVQGWKDMDTFLRMASLLQQSKSVSNR